MKRFSVILTIAAITLSPLGHAGESCGDSAGNGLAAINFVSRGGAGILVGFSEFVSPSTPPRKYLKKEFSGSWEAELWKSDGSGLAPGPVVIDSAPAVSGSFSQSAVVHQPATDHDVTASGTHKPVIFSGDNGMAVGSYEFERDWPSYGGLAFKDAAGNLIGGLGSFGSPSGPGEYGVFGVVWFAGAGEARDYAFMQLGTVKWRFKPAPNKKLTYTGAVTFNPETNSTSTTGHVEGTAFDGTTISVDNVDSAVVDENCSFTLEQTATQRRNSATGNLCSVGFGVSQKVIACEVKESLTNEFTEEMAYDRAVAAAGTGNQRTAFRLKRTSGFSFHFCSVSFDVIANVSCAGTYELRFTFDTAAHGSTTNVKPVVFTTRARLEAGTQTLKADLDVRSMTARLPGGGTIGLAYDTDYTLSKVELVGGCGNSSGGDMSSAWRSVHLRWDLGLASGGATAGSLLLDSSTITAALYSPAALTLAIGTDTLPVRDPAGVLRQVKSPTMLADITNVSAAGYDLKFYRASSIGAPDSTTGVYALQSGAEPFASYRVENPDASGQSRLKVVETRGTTTKETLFGFDSGTNTWTYSTGSGLRTQIVVVTPNPQDSRIRTETISIKEADGTVVSKTERTVRNYDWGDETIQEILDPGTGRANLTSSASYVDYVNDPGYSHVSQRINADGSWERFTYDTSTRVTKVVRPFLDSLVTDTNDASHRVTSNSYGTLADTDGDGKAEQLTTIIELTCGSETGRRYVVDWSAPVAIGGEKFVKRSTILCTASGAAWNAATNLTTTELRYGPGLFEGRTRSSIKPDGSATTTVCSAAGDGTSTIIESVGAYDSTSGAVVDGTKTTTTLSAQGHVVGVSVRDISSNLVLSSWTATEFDHLLRPTRMDYSDGTYETRDYACCGLLSSRDRAGNTVGYTYDKLGRVTDVVRDGLTTHTVYDAAGRVKQVSRIGTDDSEIVQEKNKYDLAGRLYERRDARDRLTQIMEENFPATTTITRRVTTTAPDLGTTIEEFARDRTLLKVSGTATGPRTFVDAIESGLLVRTETRLGDSGETTEWVKSVTDFAGRPLREERPALTGTGSVVTQSWHYNTAGQLDRTVDADGVTTLYGYDARGEQNIVAIDLNGNSAIDYGGGASDSADGTDRVTKTTASVAAKTVGGTVYTVQRTLTEVWDTDHSNAATTVSIVEQTSDGLHSWQTVPGPNVIAAEEGLTTATTVTVDPATATRTIAIVAPDLSQTVQVFVKGRLTSTTLKNSADGGVMNSTALAYDEHGRLKTATDARNGPTTYTWFDDDQLHTVTTPDSDTTRTGAGYDAQVTTLSYDAAGRRSTVTLPDNSVTTTEYYPTGLVKQVSGSQTYSVFYTYDKQGRLRTQKTWRNSADNATAAVTTWNYQPRRGWLENKRYADDQGPSYTYTDAGRLKTRQWARTPAVTATYDYNAAGDLKGIDYSDDTPDVSVKSDRRGRAREITDGAGTRALTYAPTGALQDEDYTAGPLATLAVHRTLDELGRLHELSSLSGATTLRAAEYTYGDASRLNTVKWGDVTATYGYVTNSSLIETLTFKSGAALRLTTARGWDNLGRLTSVSNTQSTAAALSVDYRYNAVNQRAQARRENATAWVYGYDSRGQVTSASQRQLLPAEAEPGDVIGGRSFSYLFDDLGNRLSSTVGVGSTARSTTYTSNSLNQYTERTVPRFAEVAGGAAPGTTVTLTAASGTIYPVERAGEYFSGRIPVDNSTAAQFPALAVTAVKRNGGPSAADVVATQSRAVFVSKTPEIFAHDADGNLISDSRWSYTWDAENRLVTMVTADAAAAAGVPKRKLEFGYDGQSRRVSKKVYAWTGDAWQLAESLRFVYNGWTLIAEVNAANSAVRTHIWGLDLSGTPQGAGGVGGLLGSTIGGESHLAEFDGNGNVLGYVDAVTGARSATLDYAAFGEPLVADGAAVSDLPFRFSTKYTDRESGTLYYGLRYYSPGTGRWLSRDPIGEAGGLNLYGMVGNNPINLFDPFGLNAACAALAADIAVQAGKLAAEFLKYDPVADARGGHIRGGTRQVGGRSYPNRTKPGGHYKEMMDLKRGLWNRLNEFKEKCWDDDDCDDPPKIPVWVWDVAKRPIPAPVAPLNPLQQWAVNVPEESIPTPGAAFVYGAGGAAIGIGVAVGAPLVVAGGGLLGLTPAYQ
ncbi:MAG: RHS repeat-associated core domain-containing protein [Opitutae bacterium]|nr:RHS repeat-associated core domain-containing protein [Opitutae bacterium]